MPDFKIAFQRTMDFEGRVLEQDQHDPGGQTFWGISRVHWPNWDGWSLIDSGDRTSPSLLALVEQFYINKFWNVAECDRYQSQELANQVFDAFVNLGNRAIKLLQNLIGVYDDGIVGENTMNALFKQDQNYMAGNYISARAAYYKQLIVDHPNLARYINGWLKRCTLSEATNA